MMLRRRHLHGVMFPSVQQVVVLLGVVIVSLLWFQSQSTTQQISNSNPPKPMSEFHQLAAADATKKLINFSAYQGKVVLLVNVASECGYTKNNYEELEPLYRKYAPKGLEILAFPCNQFGEQEPGSAEEVCQFVKKYDVTFPIFDKVEVNGANTHPVYKYVKGTFPADVGWNFHKYLIGKDGKPVKSYPPDVATSTVEADIAKLL